MPSPSASKAPITKRNPPPQLFQAPTNASSTSLASPSTAGTTRRIPLPRAHTARGSIDIPTLKQEAATGSRNDAAGQAEDNRVDALWAKMQLTLEEVELSALGSTHVFGNAHNAALEQLREAQISLAKAWGRGEPDDDFAAMDAAWGDDENAEEAADAPTSAGENVEDGGEIAEARKRREANERFFKKVGEGVEDVVGKLDEVAAAMAKVEKESREIWDERDSMQSSSGVS